MIDIGTAAALGFTAGLAARHFWSRLRHSWRRVHHRLRGGDYSVIRMQLTADDLTEIDRRHAE